MFASRKNPGTTSREDVQVEVCLDSKDKLYSIMVQSQEALQSVMSVPKQDTPIGSRCRHLQQHRYSQANGTPVAINRDESDESTGSYRRQMDLMRNLSPMKNERSSLFGGRNAVDGTYQHYNQRDTQSLPPERRYSRFDNETNSYREKRESSCLPALNRGDATGIQTNTNNDTNNNRPASRSIKNSNTTNNKNKPMRPTPISINSKSNKPDLVSAAASRGGFFRSIRPSIRKVQDTSI